MLIFDSSMEGISWYETSSGSVISSGKIPGINLLIYEMQNLLNKDATFAFLLVNGNSKYMAPITWISHKDRNALSVCADLFPEDNELMVKWIYHCLDTYPKNLMLLLSETAFFNHFSPEASTYALPNIFAKPWIKRYGSDGLTHQAALTDLIKLHNGRVPSKIASVHLCDQTNIASILNGIAIHSSSGFTRTEGIPSLTRIGRIDPAITIDLLKKGCSSKDIRNIYSTESGLKSMGLDEINISQLINPASIDEFHVLDYFLSELTKYLGVSFSNLNGIDIVLWTVENIGESIPFIRMVSEKFLFLGVVFQDPPSIENGFVRLTDNNSKIQVLIRSQNRIGEIISLITCFKSGKTPPFPPAAS